MFSRKLDEIRQQIMQLQVIENDVNEALDYLGACHACPPLFTPSECSECDHMGHERGAAPPLFASLSKTAAEDLTAGIHVPVGELRDSRGVQPVPTKIGAGPRNPRNRQKSGNEPESERSN